MKHDECTHCYCKTPMIGAIKHRECCMCGHRYDLSERIARLELQFNGGLRGMGA